MENPFASIDWAFAGQVDFPALTLALLLGAVLGSVLSAFYVKFGRVFGNRMLLAHVLVIMTMVTAFIISIAKTSLILSIGIFGAISIVRFRTPIKEPEELGYVFFAVAIGIGLGAGAFLHTLLAFVVILGLIALRGLRRTGGPTDAIYASIEAPAGSDLQSLMASVAAILEHKGRVRADLRRLDVRDGIAHATFHLALDDKSVIGPIAANVQRAHPAASVSFIEQRANVGA